MAIIKVETSQSYNKNIITVDPLSTTNATTTIAHSIPISTNKAVYIEVSYVANNSTYSQVIGGVVQAVFSRASGNVSRTSSNDNQGLLSTLLSSFIGMPKVNVVANTSTQTAEITVTGILATTISWHLEIIAYVSN